MFLTDAELKALTRKKQRAAQLAALRFMGVEHKPRPDGSIAVLTKHVEHLLGAADLANNTASKEAEPDWNAMSHAKISAKR